jgi:glycosyltransferase involved in cell wall biosynthesis
LTESSRVCVVMPAFRSAETLPAAAASVLGQSYGNLVLAISVYSDDEETVDAATRLDDERVVVVHRSGRGIANGRNSAIREVRADLYMFLDSDDAYDVGVVERYVDDHRAHPAPALRYGDWTAVSPVAGSWRRRRVYTPRRFCFEQLLLDNFIATPTVMIDREIVDTIGSFDEHYDHAEDWHLWLRIARRFPLRHIHGNTAFYTRTKLNRLYPRSFFRAEAEVIRSLAPPWPLRLASLALAHGRYGGYWAGTLPHRRSPAALRDVTPLDLLLMPAFVLLRTARASIARTTA